ncbi:hypothetical protein A0H81_01768 [Grifola frondosa]|uniref:Uncharacterized protein n=1 Tax=Grifola frondosa TaxID=5627 RepID=A0A1C7ML63_GRIFR|nr:hypothetical protein A0H81_01768 [Grifola frondosa]
MATSTSYPPRLQLSPQTNATSIKRSFDELGLDEISSADEQASGSGTSHSSTGNAEGSNDRNKRARSESDSSGVDEIDEIFVASNGSYSSSSGLMGGRDIAVVSSNSLQAALSVNATDLSTNPVPPNTSNVGVENPDIEMEDMLPFVFRAISPPNVPPPRTPHSDANEQYRLSLERFNDFDREISALRRAPFSPALASILDQGDVIASTGSSSAEDRPAIHPSSSASGSTLVTDSQVSVSTRSCPVSHSLDATPSTFSYPLWPLHSHEDRSVPFGSMPFAARARRRVARMSPSEDDTIAASWLDTSSTDAQPRSTSQYLRQMERTYVDRLRLIRERRNAFPDATEPIDDEDSLNSTLRFRSRNAVDRFPGAFSVAWTHSAHDPPEVSLRAPGEHRSHLASLDRPSDTFFPQTGPEDAGPTRPFFPYNRVASPSTRSSERDGNSASRPLASYVLPESRFSTLANALSSPGTSRL